MSCSQSSFEGEYIGVKGGFIIGLLRFASGVLTMARIRFCFFGGGRGRPLLRGNSQKQFTGPYSYSRLLYDNYR